MDDLIEHLKESGVTILNEPITVPSEDVKNRAGISTLCWFLHLDEVLLELSEYH